MQRRNLIKTAGAAIAAAAASSSWAAEKSAVADLNWTEEADVVILGFGGAGAAAAIEAHDAKTKVLILEKTAEGGGNTSVSAGGIMIPKNKDEAYEYLEKTFDYAGSEMDAGLLKTFTEEIVKQPEFLRSLGEGVEMFVYGGAGFPSLPHADTIEKWTFRYAGKSAGPALFAMYKNAVETTRGIKVHYETPAKRLITENGVVVGVEAEHKGKKAWFRAKKAVILATGGYEYSQEMLRNYAKGIEIHALGCPGNTGDGIMMAQALGAKLWHMTSYSCPIGAIVPGKESVASSNMPRSGIWVDQDGKRFVNEKAIDTHTCLYAVDVMDPVGHRYPRIPAFLVFDEKARKEGPVAGGIKGWLGYREGYTWSRDNEVEIKAGLIKKGDTIEELAEAAGIDPKGLAETVKAWNADMAAGGDKTFGRSVKNAKDIPVSAPIDRGPFYALPLVPALLNTQGGPRRNGKGQVLDAFGEPIPRLYVAGEMGSMWGSIYQGACNNAEALVFGRIAGREAAQEC